MKSFQFRNVSGVDQNPEINVWSSEDEEFQEVTMIQTSEAKILRETSNYYLKMFDFSCLSHNISSEYY